MGRTTGAAVLAILVSKRQRTAGVGTHQPQVSIGHQCLAALAALGDAPDWAGDYSEYSMNVRSDAFRH